LTRSKLFTESTEPVATRLPSSVVGGFDIAVSKGLFKSRADALRLAAIEGLKTMDWKEDLDFAAHLEALKTLVTWKTRASRLKEYLAELEEPLAIAMRTKGGNPEAKEILEKTLKYIGAFPAFWQQVAKEFMEESSVYTKALERFGKPEGFGTEL